MVLLGPLSSPPRAAAARCAWQAAQHSPALRLARGCKYGWEDGIAEGEVAEIGRWDNAVQMLCRWAGGLHIEKLLLHMCVSGLRYKWCGVPTATKGPVGRVAQTQHTCTVCTHAGFEVAWV